MSETAIQEMMDTMLDLRAECAKQMERRAVLERLIKLNGSYISIVELCAIFDIEAQNENELKINFPFMTGDVSVVPVSTPCKEE